MKRFSLLLILGIISQTAFGKVDLVTLPSRDAAQITIYNSADLTLVRDSRSLTIKEGKNKLQFSWAGTLIDPTSLEILPKAQVDKIDITDLTFPSRVKNLGLWNIDSRYDGKVPVEISYLTSGLSWQAFYMGTMSEDESTMRLQGYVRVTNNSGEDYENTQTRLIVGKVHLLDRIAELARREQPYGRPNIMKKTPVLERLFSNKSRLREREAKNVLFVMAGELAEKEIVKQGLSEYFLYTIEGTETISNGFSKRLPSMDIDNVPVVNLYKYEEEKYGSSVVRFLSFANDQEYEMGETPIPGGTLKVYRTIDQDQHLSYEGQSSFKYIPVGEEVELNMGAVRNIVVKPMLMNYKTENYEYDRKDNITGYDEIKSFTIEVKNTRNVPVKVEIKRNFGSHRWDLQKSGSYDEFEKVDADTVRFSLELEPASSQQFEYTLTTYRGSRE